MKREQQHEPDNRPHTTRITGSKKYKGVPFKNKWNWKNEPNTS